MFRKSVLSLGVAICLGTAVVGMGQEDGKQARQYPPQLPGAKVDVYKTVGEVRLNLYRYEPPGHQPSDRRAAIVFFFGGGWKSGSPQQFQPHCEYLASRGMVAMVADYRVSSRHNVKAVDCIRDAKSAIRWVRKESGRLGIDPSRIAAAGGSAGGHLAAACGVIKGLDEANEEAGVSSVPNALVLFNPALVLTSLDAELQDRMGAPAGDVSPYHHVTSGQPPTIIFHGRADTTVPYRTAEAFTQAMRQAGNRCELIGYADQAHGFFNYGRGNGDSFRDTTRKMDEFLALLGYVTGPPTLEKK